MSAERSPSVHPSSRAILLQPSRNIERRSRALIAARRTRRSVTLSAVLGAFIAVTACAGGNNPPAANHVLVVDKSFDMKTADPQREFEVSGGIVAKALYSTLLTFKGADSATPVPSVAKSYTASSDAKTYTFKLRTDIKFSDGTRPYTLKWFSTPCEVALVAYQSYWGPKPYYSTVVIRNVQAPAQLINIQKGTDEVALDLSPDQASALSGAGSVQVKAIPGPNVFFLFSNNNSQISSITPNKHFQNAIRYGLDYQSFVQLAGAGAIQTPGVLPSMFLGALSQADSVKRNLTKAKAELAASGISNPTVNLGFPSDFTLNGLSFSTLAQKVQANLQEVGIKVNLTGSPISVSLADYRAGKEQLGLWLWGPDYPDPNDYLVFLPGQLVGLRAGWAAGADSSLEALGTQAGSTTDNNQRGQLFQQIQRQLNTDGPFFPLIQPGQVVVATKGVTGADYNPTWTIDVAGVGG